MKLPCKTCLKLPMCIGGDVIRLKSKCKSLSNCIKTRKGLSNIIGNSYNKSKLVYRNKETRIMIYINFEEHKEWRMNEKFAV